VIGSLEIMGGLFLSKYEIGKEEIFSPPILPKAGIIPPLISTVYQLNRAVTYKALQCDVSS
jgi:hypothetical protein